MKSKFLIYGLAVLCLPFFCPAGKSAEPMTREQVEAQYEDSWYQVASGKVKEAQVKIWNQEGYEDWILVLEVGKVKKKKPEAEAPAPKKFPQETAAVAPGKDQCTCQCNCDKCKCSKEKATSTLSQAPALQLVQGFDGRYYYVQGTGGNVCTGPECATAGIQTAGSQIVGAGAQVGTCSGGSCSAPQGRFRLFGGRCR